MKYIPEVDGKYPKKLHNLHGDLRFLLQKMKIDKCEKLLGHLSDYTNYAIHTKTLIYALNYELIPEK